MKQEQKIIIFLTIGFLFYFIFRQRINIKGAVMTLPLNRIKKVITESEIINALQKVKSVYGETIAQYVEQIYRVETAHFKSSQFLYTYSAGMLKFKDKYPYGWGNFKTFWAINPSYAPTNFYKIFVSRENKDFYYLGFNSLEAAMMTLAYYVNKNGRLRWNSTLAKEQAIYQQALNSVINRYV